MVREIEMSKINPRISGLSDRFVDCVIIADRGKTEMAATSGGNNDFILDIFQKY